MARRQTVLAFDAKMYKHFALVTLALTGAIALFADGEKRAVVVEKATEIQEFAEKKEDKSGLIIRNSDAGAGRGPGLSGFYSDVGQNIYGTGFASSSPHTSRRLIKLAKSVTDAQLAQLGLSREQFLAMSDQDKQSILSKINNGKESFASESTVKNSTAASLRRSGGSGQSADY